MEWMCFVASVLLIPKNVQPKYWRAFILYLGVTVIVESYTHYLGRIVATPQNNHAIYNAFLLVYMPFHVWVFSKLIALKNIKILCAILLLGLLFGYAIEWAHQGFGFYFYRTNTAFSGVVVLLCIVYYFSLFMQNEYYDLLKDASFWFVTGCLIFYATNTAVNAFFAELVRVRVKGQVSLRYIIITILNILMYVCWIKSFLCLRNKQIYTQR
jgi:hypothetical protein